jgi:1,4-alpha-glucan branching enzyme
MRPFGRSRMRHHSSSQREAGAGKQLHRITKLADGSNSRSWYARSRTRVANALLLTAPGIPQLSMGQEFLEDKPCDTDPSGPNLLEWDRVDGDSDRALMQGNGANCRYRDGTVFSAVAPGERPAY